MSTQTGNKRTPIPLVSWTMRGGSTVDLTLTQNSHSSLVTWAGLGWRQSLDVLVAMSYDSDDIPQGANVIYGGRQEETILNAMANESMIVVRTLDEALEMRRPIAVYTNAEEPDSFAFGYVLARDKTFVSILNLAGSAQPDSTLVLRLGDVYQVATGLRYLADAVVSKQVLIAEALEKSSRPRSFREAFMHCKRHDRIITVAYYSGGHYESGLALEFGSDALLIDSLGDDGLTDGLTAIKLGEVRALEFGGIGQVTIERMRAAELSRKASTE